MTGADAVADALYGLPPDRFIEARNARAKEIAASGDRPTAAAVRKLPKPSLSAWLANVLVREHRSAVDDLLDLGRALRLAQERGSGQEMRTLSGRRQELVDHLVAFAADEARASGLTLGAQPQRQLEATLDAAVADESAAVELRRGRLTKPLRHVGFGDVTTLQRGAQQRWVDSPPPAATSPGIRRGPIASRGGDRLSARTVAEQALADRAHDAGVSRHRSRRSSSRAGHGVGSSTTRSRGIARSRTPHGAGICCGPSGGGKRGRVPVAK